MRRSFLHSAGRAFLSLGGIGFSPFLSPTLATAVSALLLWLLALTAPVHPQQRAAVLLLVFIAVAALALVALTQCVPKQHYDQRFVVIDEFLGMFAALLPSLLSGAPTLFLLCAAFGIFRIIDHTKPLFISRIDACNTPASVLLDDIIAGIYTAFLLAVLSELFPLMPLHAAWQGAM